MFRTIKGERPKAFFARCVYALTMCLMADCHFSFEVAASLSRVLLASIFSVDLWDELEDEFGFELRGERGGS